MSTQTTDEIEYDEAADADLPEPARQRLRNLEKENKRLKGLESENSNLKQQAAISQAGLELNDTQRKALLATHEGESTPELLRKTAEALGFAEPLPENDPADVEAHNKLADARNGAGNVTADQSYEDEMAGAKSRDEAKQIALKHNRPWAD